MYGSIFRMKVKPGKEQVLKEVFDEWERDRKPKIQGTVKSFVMRPDDKTDELIGVAIFPDKASYKANADDPEQDNWYKKMRELLEDDPEWEDGEYIFGDL